MRIRILFFGGNIIRTFGIFRMEKSNCLIRTKLVKETRKKNLVKYKNIYIHGEMVLFIEQLVRISAVIFHALQ